MLAIGDGGRGCRVDYGGSRHFSCATISRVMTRRQKSKRSNRKSSANRKLAALFKMSREEVVTRKTTGGGIHQTDPRHASRGQQKRRAINDQLD